MTAATDSDPKLVQSAGREPAAKSPRPTRRELEELRVELQARIAESDWLKAHYDQQLRAAFAQIEALQSRMRTLARPAREPSGEGPADAEIDALRKEVERLGAAEARYLDRIEELKEAIGRDEHSPR